MNKHGDAVALPECCNSKMKIKKKKNLFNKERQSIMGKETQGTIFAYNTWLLNKKQGFKSILPKKNWEVCRTNAINQQFKASDGPHYFSQVIINVEKAIFCLFLHCYKEGNAFHIITIITSSNSIKEGGRPIVKDL